MSQQKPGVSPLTICCAGKGLDALQHAFCGMRHLWRSPRTRILFPSRLGLIRHKLLNIKAFTLALRYSLRGNPRKFPVNHFQSTIGVMDRRQSPRIEVQLPVQVWGMDAHGQPFTNSALVTNLSTGGLVIQGLTRKIRTGEILDVQMGQEKAQFRVVWVGSQGTSELGLQRTTAHAFFANSVLAHCSQAAAAC